MDTALCEHGHTDPMAPCNQCSAHEIEGAGQVMDTDNRLVERSLALLDHRLAKGEHGYVTMSCSDLRRIRSRASQLSGVVGDALWFDKAIRAHEAEHGPSGGAWNISMILERLHRSFAAFNNTGGQLDGPEGPSV